ncbi:hypothetical protein FACS1894106_0520 [Spirochaetia bacterium]|nr:hypothetical protein FACS1894106_0520 [Spirochaetia bacterium]
MGHPLPLAAGLPPLWRAAPAKYVGFTPDAPCGRSGRKPFINGSMGEERPASRWSACRKVKKNTGLHAGVFFVAGGILPPRQ